MVHLPAVKAHPWVAAEINRHGLNLRWKPGIVVVHSTALGAWSQSACHLAARRSVSQNAGAFQTFLAESTRRERVTCVCARSFLVPRGCWPPPSACAAAGAAADRKKRKSVAARHTKERTTRNHPGMRIPGGHGRRSLEDGTPPDTYSRPRCPRRTPHPHRPDRVTHGCAA